MQVGVQFNGTIPGGESQQWQTVDWPEAWHVVWSVVPTTSSGGADAPQVTWEVEVERATGNTLNYWFTIKNLTPSPVAIEARYAVLS